MHRFQAVAQAMGRSINEAAVIETVQFARIMAHTAHWVLHVHHHWSEEDDTKEKPEENPFVIRDE